MARGRAAERPARARARDDPRLARRPGRRRRDAHDRRDAHALILDGEVIALEETGRPRPFQDTMRRFGRKLAVEDVQAEVPLSLFCFDCLHADGVDLIDRPTEERVAALARHVRAATIVPRLVTGERAAAEAFLGAALDLGHEGLMAKSLAASYEAGSRGVDRCPIRPRARRGRASGRA